MRVRYELSRPSGLPMLRDGASRLLGMRVRYFILLIGEERAQASVSKDFRSLLVLCLIPIPVERFAGIGLEDESDLPPPSANALRGSDMRPRFKTIGLAIEALP